MFVFFIYTDMIVHIEFDITVQYSGSVFKVW